MARQVLHNRAFRLLVAAGLAAAVLVSLAQRVTAIEQARESWSVTDDVVVATRAIEAGGSLRGAVEMAPVPRALVPETALREIVPGARAKVAMHEGEIVLSPRVTHSARRGLPAGSMALTLAVQARVPLVEAGDLVDLWTIDPAQRSSRKVASNVVVLDLSDDDITVAVRDHQVAHVTVATLGPVTVALVG